MVFKFQPKISRGLNRNSLLQFDRALRDVFVDSITEIAPAIQEDLESVVEHWSRKPSFRFALNLTTNRHTAELVTDSDVWRWLDQGTEPHPIPGSKTNKLSFPGWGRNNATPFSSFVPGAQGTYYPDTYSASTSPGSFDSVEAEYHGDQLAVSQGTVQHPGIEARNWSVLIGRKHGPEFQRILSRNLGALII